MINKSLFSSKDQTWETPSNLINLIKSKFYYIVNIFNKALYYLYFLHL